MVIEIYLSSFQDPVNFSAKARSLLSGPRENILTYDFLLKHCQVKECVQFMKKTNPKKLTEAGAEGVREVCKRTKLTQCAVEDVFPAASSLYRQGTGQ